MNRPLFVFLALLLAGSAPAGAQEGRDEAADARERQLAEGNRRFEGGDFAGAAQRFERILQDGPQSYDILFRLARAYHELGDSERFQPLVRRLLGLDASRPEAYLLIGRRAQKDGTFPDAEAAYRRSLELDPDNADALTGLAEVCLAQGFLDQALSYLDRLLAVYPDSIPLLWLAARSVREPARQRQLYSRILAATPGGDSLAEGRLSLLEQWQEKPFFHVEGLEKPEKVRLYFTPGKISRAQFVAQDGLMGAQGAHRRRATPNTPYIRVKVNGTGPHKFLLDTGTQGIHISRALARKLELPSHGTSRFEGLGLGDTVYGEIVFLESLQLDGVLVKNIPAETIDLVGIGDGILNPAALRDVRVHLFNSRRSLVLSRHPEPGEEDPLRPRADARRDAPVTLPFLSFHGHMVIRVEIEGMVANALIDTGAESSILDLSVLERIPRLESFDVAGYGVTLEGITGQVLEARVVREAQLTIAGKNLRTTNMFAADLRRLTNFYGPRIDAILGMNQLKLFDIMFDFRKNEVTFQRIVR